MEPTAPLSLGEWRRRADASQRRSDVRRAAPERDPYEDLRDAVLGAALLVVLVLAVLALAVMLGPAPR